MRPHIYEYLVYLAKLRSPYNRIGDLEKGEIQITTDPEKILRIERATMKRLGEKEGHPEWGRIGVCYEDRAFLVVRDPVLVPTDEPGGEPIPYAWSRVIWKGNNRGKAVLIVPFTDDGRLLLNCEYRHPARRWVLAWPGGQVDQARTCEEAVKQELREEAGYTTSEIFPLSDETFFPDPATNGTGFKFFAVKLGEHVGTEREFGEVMASPVLLTREEFEQAFKKGGLKHPETGLWCSMHSGRVGHGYLLAKLHGLI